MQTHWAVVDRETGDEIVVKREYVTNHMLEHKYLYNVIVYDCEGNILMQSEYSRPIGEEK